MQRRHKPIKVDRDDLWPEVGIVLDGVTLDLRDSDFVPNFSTSKNHNISATTFLAFHLTHHPPPTMSLLTSLANLPSTSYSHPISSRPESSQKLNPYLPLPSASTLFTDETFIGSLPPASASSVIHVLGAQTISIPRGDDKLVLISREAQEAYDHALVALKVARSGSTVYHFIGSSALEGSVQELSEVESWLDTHDSPALNGQSDEERDAAEEVVHRYEAAALSLLKLTRRAQRPFVPHSAESSRVIVNFLPSSTDLSGQNVLDITVASPLPCDKIRHAVKGNEEVVVLEGGSGKWGASWAAIVDALDGMETPIRSVLVGSNGDVKSALSSSATISRTGSALAAPTIPSTSVAVPTAENSYTELLHTSPSPLEILNDPASLAASESTSPLYAFGKAVAIRQERQRLIELAKTVLKAPNTKQEVHETLGQWLLVREEQGSSSAGEKVEAALGEGSSSDEKELLALGQRGHWTKRSLWIVISNSWAQDLASSGLHHALASGLDINLLVYETQPSPFSPLAGEQSKRERKKDLALYALNMGDVYVSSVAVYADYAGVINAMREAEKYSGPGLVLAYLPWGEKEDGESVGQGEVAGPLERLRETKRAVSGGWWPMFRWNPSLEDDKKFTLDSPAVKAALTEFLDRQSHLSQLTRATPALDSTLTSSKGSDLVAARKEKARKAYDALVNSLDGPGLLILFASDSGNAEKVAKRLISRAKMRGVAASIGVLDGIATSIVDSLSAEKNVVIITSTAGQGEAPQNGREFFKALSKLSAAEVEEAMKETKVAVFGMGDSNYWPRKEDYVYYNKPAKELAPKLADLGIAELQPLGLGDDSDPDGFQTGYKPWEATLWKSLGVDSVEVAEAVEETVANEHIKIASDYLRGTILEGLADTTTGAIGASDAQLTKFHGTYMQDDRDVRESLQAQGLEPAYSFMIRCRMPAGVCTAQQWLQMDAIADEHGNSTFKLTTRQTFQFHGIIKKHLKPAMQAINKALLDTIAACGDVSEYNDAISQNLANLRPKRSMYRQPGHVQDARDCLRLLGRLVRALAAPNFRLPRDLAGQKEGRWW